MAEWDKLRHRWCQKGLRGGTKTVPWWLILPFLCRASDGLEKTPFSLKETWTPLPLVEAGNASVSLSVSICGGKSCMTFQSFPFLYFSLSLCFCSGHFGLWVDENLYLGRSSPCYTFNNCCLSETDDFRVMELEVWTFSWRDGAADWFLFDSPHPCWIA